MRRAAPNSSRRFRFLPAIHLNLVDASSPVETGLSISAAGLQDFVDRGFSRANSGYKWIYENRGTIYLTSDDGGEITGRVRDVEIRTAEDGLFAVVLVVVPHDDINTLRGRLPSGTRFRCRSRRLLASWLQVDDNGTVLADPTNSSEECRALQEMTGE